ncbi:MAG TPA: DNA alkylation repair protein [Edaphocola sp.]|nr:DNA alkylation repair protein [Edaphocola sp.]
MAEGQLVTMVPLGIVNRIEALKEELAAMASPEKAQVASRFFKTGEGQYGAGDRFIGVTMPEQRRVAKKFYGLTSRELEKLLHEPVHECRMTALIILVQQFGKGSKGQQEEIYGLYLRNTEHINNWDLVDASAEFIVGPWLEDKSEKMQVLRKLAKSQSLWERRIAMLSTFAYIKKGEPKAALQVAQWLLRDEQDLIHKAVGWMLREIGKRCSAAAEEEFLRKYYKQMPRTMLRYALEHFPEEKRKSYMRGEM